MRRLNFVISISGCTHCRSGLRCSGQTCHPLLKLAGRSTVAVSDSGGTIYNPDGLDVEKLIAIKAEGGMRYRIQDGEKLDREDIIDIECDIWIPAARPDVIHEDNVHS